MERCKVEFCQGSSSAQKWFFLPLLLSKMSGCLKEQMLCSPSLRTMKNLFGRDMVLFSSVSNYLVWGIKWEAKLLERERSLILMEALRNAGNGAWCLDKVFGDQSTLHNAKTLFFFFFWSQMSTLLVAKYRMHFSPAVFKQQVKWHLHRWKTCD